MSICRWLCDRSDHPGGGQPFLQVLVICTKGFAACETWQIFVFELTPVEVGDTRARDRRQVEGTAAAVSPLTQHPLFVDCCNSTAGADADVDPLPLQRTGGESDGWTVMTAISCPWCNRFSIILQADNGNARFT